MINVAKFINSKEFVKGRLMYGTMVYYSKIAFFCYSIYSNIYGLLQNQQITYYTDMFY